MSTEKFKGSYEIADGYVGGSRPQYFTFFSGDLEDDMTDEEILAAYDEAAEDHFREHASANTRNQEAFLAWAREQLNKREQS